jgi:hypothetical protein
MPKHIKAILLCGIGGYLTVLGVYCAVFVHYLYAGFSVVGALLVAKATKLHNE